jgi:hypothetical protein
MDVSQACPQARIRHLSLCNIVVYLRETCRDQHKSILTARPTRVSQSGKATREREIHADATGGRGHARRSARGHKVRPVARQCDAGTQRDAETIRLLQSIHSGLMCCVGGMAISERADESAYIRCINLIIARVNPTPHSRIAGCLQSAPLLVPLSTSRSCVPYTIVQRHTRL